MANDTLRKVRSYLRQIEKMAEQGNLEGIKRDAGLAMRLCNDGPTMKSAEGQITGRADRGAAPFRGGAASLKRSSSIFAPGLVHEALVVAPGGHEPR